jgi:hypothetical protein
MLTTPTAWQQAQFNISGFQVAILELTDGSNTVYFGTSEMQLGTIHVYGYLKSIGTITERIDPFKRTWDINNVQVSIHNLPFRKDSSGNWQRPSDYIWNIRNKTAKIYLGVGCNITSLNDCILRYSGRVADFPEYDEKEYKIEINNQPISLETTLPKYRIGDVFQDCFIEQKNIRIPLVYGKFYYSSAAAKHPGLAKGYVIRRKSAGIDFVFASHQLSAGSTRYIYHSDSDYSDPAQIIDSFTVNNSNQFWITVQVLENTNNYLYVRPENTDGTDSLTSWMDTGTNPTYAYDLDPNTAHIVNDNWDDDGTTMKGWGFYGFADWNKFTNKLNTIINNNGKIAIGYKVAPAAGITLSTTTVGLVRWSDQLNTWTRDQLSATFDDTYRISQSYTPGSTAGSWKNNQLLIEGWSSTGADGTKANKDLFLVKDVYIRFEYSQSGFDQENNIWIRTDGRTFGNWIDSPGRSNPYNQNDVIEHPAGIIESLLRDELGWTDNEIDTDSFDNIYTNQSTKHLLNLTDDNADTAKNIIKKICEQSLFLFCYSNQGKARLIDVSQAGTTARTIPFSHIIGGRIEVGVANKVINKLVVKSRYWSWVNEYQDVTNYEDSNSQSLYGTEQYEVEWPNVHPDSLNSIGQHYVKTADGGIWSIPKYEIKFATFGVMHADLEVGDWIELDSNSADAQLQFYGGTWSGKKFMITEIRQSFDKTEFTAVRLYS